MPLGFRHANGAQAQGERRAGPALTEVLSGAGKQKSGHVRMQHYDHTYVMFDPVGSIPHPNYWTFISS